MRIGIVGCAGQMGRMLVEAVLDSGDMTLAGGTERPGHPSLGGDIARAAGRNACGLTIGSDVDALFAESDAVIDFTTPDGTLAHAEAAARHRRALIIGTTGLSEAHRSAIATAAAVAPVVQAANMSLGVNILLGLASRAAAALGSEYDIEILEMHHRRKVDAPSGTALALGEAVAAARGVDLASAGVRTRDGHTGARPDGAIGFATLRGGDVVGDHTVMFAGPGERIELTHRAQSRHVFASGALAAARWTEGRPPGLYGMRDVLGLT